MQNLDRSVHLLKSIKSAIASPLALEIKSVCQRQLEQIVNETPIVGAGIFYRTNQEERYSIAHNKQRKPSVDPNTLSYLQSEVWLERNLPKSVLLQVVYNQASSTFSFINTQDISNEITEEIETEQPDLARIAYIYILDESETSDEYVLLWAARTISPSHKKNLEQQIQLFQNYLRSSQERWRQQQEIEILKETVRKGAHQLRNPLALIGLYAENLCLELPEGLFQEQAKIIRETAKDLSNNLNSLFHCGQQAKVRVQLEDLHSILTETLEILRPKLVAKKLVLNYPNTSVNLMVDKWQMKQVFDTILSNAIEFSEEGQTITCNWQVFCTEVLVEICDRGPGLSAQDLKEAFTPYYSRRPGGSGLGLAIAKKIILAHKGSIWAKNLYGGGAQFCFTLPR